MEALWSTFPALRKARIKVYGWADPGITVSTSNNSNIPESYAIVPNKPELDQGVLRIERVPDTVQTRHLDWGFRLTPMYGIDYRWTTAQGWFSGQLLNHNRLYGFDPVEAYALVYVPFVAKGMVIKVGRYISPPDIEAQLAPGNYLFTHSLMFTYDGYTQTGINAAVKLNDQWSVLFGIHAGDDIAPWNGAAHPTAMAMVRWVSAANNDSLWGGIDSLNGREIQGWTRQPSAVQLDVDPSLQRKPDFPHDHRDILHFSNSCTRRRDCEQWPSPLLVRRRGTRCSHTWQRPRLRNRELHGMEVFKKRFPLCTSNRLHG
jgi:hypothetical protein